MSKHRSKNIAPHIPFVYEMAISFFAAAREAIDPVLTSLDGYKKLETEETGVPVAPEAFVQKFGKLLPNDQLQFLGLCLRATTNLGLAYTHVMGLLVDIESGQKRVKKQLSGSIDTHLVQLYDMLSKGVKKEIESLYDSVGFHDFEMEISLRQGAFEEQENDDRDGLSFRQLLCKWQKLEVLTNSHLLFSKSDGSVVRLLIPLRAIFILDGILGSIVAPRLNVKYIEMDDQMSSRTDNPKVDWDGRTMHVTLPDKLGRILRASWEVSETSVVRIKEKGAEKWFVGVETPFQSLTFVDRDPNTEYVVQITRKNQAGESLPVESVIEKSNSQIENTQHV